MTCYNMMQYDSRDNKKNNTICSMILRIHGRRTKRLWHPSETRSKCNKQSYISCRYCHETCSFEWAQCLNGSSEHPNGQIQTSTKPTRACMTGTEHNCDSYSLAYAATLLPRQDCLKLIKHLTYHTHIEFCSLKMRSQFGGGLFFGNQFMHLYLHPPPMAHH